MFSCGEHHLFVRIMKHVTLLIARERAHAMSFPCSRGDDFLASNSGKKTSCVYADCSLCERCPIIKSFVVLTSQLLSAIGGDATINFCGKRTLIFSRR